MKEVFDFDKIVDRRAWHAKKYDKLEANYGRTDVLPLWIADMNFESPKCVQEELQRISAFDVYGYFSEPYEYRQSIIEWYQQEYQWELQRDWINFVPGLVHGLSYAILGLTGEGDKILVQKPVYNSFFDLPEQLHREVIDNPVVAIAGAQPGESYYRMDLDGLETLLIRHEATGRPVRLMVLCNPQNPQGIRWTKEELTRLARICHRHHLIVISDESFCDLQLWGGKHTPFATVCPEAKAISITFATPTKTFNISGLVTSFAIIPNEELRSRFFGFLDANEYNYPLFFSMMPSIAAYRKGKPWLRQLLRYIERNILTFEEMCAGFVDADGQQYIIPQRPQTSYLVWVDCRRLLSCLAGKPMAELSMTDHALLEDYFTNHVRVALNSGKKYGPMGIGFMRFNLAIPNAQLRTLQLNQLPYRHRPQNT